MVLLLVALVWRALSGVVEVALTEEPEYVMPYTGLGLEVEMGTVVLYCSMHVVLS